MLKAAVWKPKAYVFKNVLAIERFLDFKMYHPGYSGLFLVEIFLTDDDTRVRKHVFRK